MTSLGLSLLWSAMQATLIGVVAIVLGARPWRLGGAFTPLVALLAIAVLTLCSLMPLPGWWPERPVADASERVTEKIMQGDAVGSVLKDDAPVAAPPMAQQPLFLDLTAAFLDELKSVRSQSDAGWMRSSVPTWIVGVFALSIALGLARLLLGVIGAREIRRSSQVINDKALSELLDVLQAELGVKARVELRQANELGTAATIGYVSPAILLPSHWRAWQAQELRAVLSHELAHIHHRDFATQLLAQLGLILHFYNPMMHWLSERLKLEQELAADRVAAQLAGGRRDYLRVLANLAIENQNHTVGWPARAFLPTRNSFLRRLEMLRVSNGWRTESSVAGRLSALAVISLFTLGLVFLRPESGLSSAKASGGVGPAPAESVTETTLVQEAAKPAAVAANAYELRYLGVDVEMVAGMRPAELLKNSQLKSVYETLGKQLTKGLPDSSGLNAENVEQIVFGTGLQPDVTASMSLFVKLTKASKISDAMVKGKAIEIGGQSAIELAQGLVLWQPDDRSIVISTRTHIEKLVANRFTYKAFTVAKAWSEVSQDDAFMLVSGKLARSRWESAEDPAALALKSSAAYLGPIVNEAAYIGFGASLSAEMRLTMVVECLDEKGTEIVRASALAGVDKLKNSLKGFVGALGAEAKVDTNNKSAASPQQSFGSQLTQFALSALEKVESRTTGNLVKLSSRFSDREFPGELLGNLTGAARRAAQRQTSSVNMKQLGLSIHNYHDAYAALPQSAITQPSAKQKLEPRKYPYSWRVALLPWLEQSALYNKYKFDEPWDSPSNLEVLKQMPAVYRHPDAPADSTNTSYVILVGDTTMFPPGRLAKFADINDGMANTLMVVEAKTSIPWTKPEDFEYAPDKPLPKFGGYSKEGYNVMMADGTVRFFSTTLDEALLRKLITAQGGEPIN